MENILSVDLSSVTSPVVEEVRGKDWIEYGTEEWANLYPQFLIDLYNNSSTHSAIINTTAGMICGDDIIIDEDGKEENVDRYVKLQNFFNYANGKETLHEVLQKVSLDFKLQGAFGLHLIYNKAKTEIVEIYHIPVERIRAGIPNAMGVVDTYYVSADWSDTRDNIPTPIAAFNSNDRTGASQLLYSGLYSPNMDVYHTPDYLAANNWALVDQKVAEFHLHNISNGFSGSYVFSFANGVPTQDERIAIERNIAKKFQGSSNAGKVILTFSDDKTRTPEITPISVSGQDKQFLALQELLVQNILTGHRVVSPLLFGIKSDSGLGSNVDELNAAFEVYLNTVVKGFQVHILRVLAKIFKINDMDMPISFVQAKPITTQFTIDDMRSVMTQEEIREELGLAPLEQDEVVEDDDFDKIGMIDGKPVYNTKEEAIANAERLGCSGYHEHEYEGNTVYMACESHDELMNFGKTELQSFLDTMEDIPEDWELVEEEKVEDEHEDFDFEQSLNEFANDKTELASTGIARPNAKTRGKNNQDGVNKSFNDYYKVRYVYAKDNFLSQKGETRDFCRLMTSAKKIYRKQDIINMGSMEVNKGWGPKGNSATYSIWFWKGGGNCHHYWLRQIYKTSLTNAKSNISPSQLIGYTKAKSEGFTAQKNDNKVAKAPKRMKNNGFKNRR